jgi:hypothetical protein
MELASQLVEETGAVLAELLGDELARQLRLARVR